MTKPIGIKTAEYLKNTLLRKSAPISEFKEKQPDLEFSEQNSIVWQFILLKSFEPEFSYYIPLAHHLLENKLCEVNKDTLQYSILAGYQAEIAFNKMREVQDGINETMQGFRFDEKMVITNKPVENMISIAKKIIDSASPEILEEAVSAIKASNVDVSKIGLLSNSIHQQKSPKP